MLRDVSVVYVTFLLVCTFFVLNPSGQTISTSTAQSGGGDLKTQRLTGSVAKIDLEADEAVKHPKAMRLYQTGSHEDAAGGGPAPLVFVEADEMTNAITPSGLYAVYGAGLRNSVVLFRNGKQVGREISVSGKTIEAESLIRQLAAKMLKEAN